MGYDRVRLKRDVKQAMRDTRPRPMVVALLFGIIVSVGTGLLNSILGGLLTGGTGDYSEQFLYYVQRGYEMDEAGRQILLDMMSRGPGALISAAVGSAVLSILVSLWQSIMGVGYRGYALSMVRRENPDTGRIFCAFPRIGGVAVTCILVGVFRTLWQLLLCVGVAAVGVGMIVAAAAIGSELIMFLFLLLAFVALALGSVWVTMRYALTDYALLDQNLSGMDAIRESKRLMKGNIGRGFLLQLSFFGWYLLIILLVYIGVGVFIMAIGVQLALGGADDLGGLIASAGVGLLVLVSALIGAWVLGLWLRPYETGAMAKFYDWAKGSADGISRGPGYGSGADGWSEHIDYTWNSGPTAGTGVGSGPRDGGNPPQQPPRAPKSPRDDPWE